VSTPRHGGPGCRQARGGSRRWRRPRRTAWPRCTAPSVGVVGYSLGGGIGWYARALGQQANSITAVELVTADGWLLRVDADHDRELFWALRGGGGSFGVVTALEFALYLIRTACSGMLAWNWQHTRAVLDRWVPWAADAPDLVTTCLRIQQIPPLAAFPALLRGRALPLLNGQFLLFASTNADTPRDQARGLADARRIITAMSPFSSGSQYLNFATRAVDVSSGYHPDAWSRLRAVRAAVDPDQVLLANHPVPPA
jgi:FAD/FMN-containing dehydrogenase